MEPFDTPIQSALDFSRIIIFLGGMALIGSAAYVSIRSERARSTPTYPWTTLALSLFTFTASFAELQRLGHGLTWHLLPKAAGLICAFLALYKTSVFVAAPERWD